MVKSPDFKLAGGWVQHECQITNAVPEGATPEEMQSARSSETFTGMVLKTMFRAPVTIELEAAFDHRMCPLIVLAGELAETDLGVPEYRQDTQIVVYDEGSIVWSRPMYATGPKLLKLAWLGLDLKAHDKHRLRVEVTGKAIAVTLNGHTFGCTDECIPEEFYVGIAGCEGINRFYSFAVAPSE